MKSQREIIRISEFILELTSMGGLDNDLDGLLSRMFSVFEKLPSFKVQPRAIIRMYNPRGQMVIVAQHGFGHFWANPSIVALFSDVDSEPRPAAFTVPLNDVETVLVLPLTNDNQPLGQVLIGIDPQWLLKKSDFEFMSNLARALSGLLGRCLMNEALQVRELELEDARSQAIRRLGVASEYRDNETGLHVLRMTNIAGVIAKALGLGEAQRELLFITAPMHDVGKIGIPDSILLKPGQLNSEEFDIMKSHTEIGGRILHGGDILLEAARDIALSHHENWDGSGYPQGLKGENISVLARICSIADVFDALTSSRPYKAPWEVEDAVAWIVSESGKKFDPAVVAAFEKALPEILRIRELYREDIINPDQILKLPKIICYNTRWVEWDQSLSVGIDVIDEHHRYLFDLTNDLIDVLANKLGAREMGRILKALGQYAQVHFAAEEQMMEHYGYQRIGSQKLQHKQFGVKLKDFYAELRENPIVAQFDVATYLREWLVAHIRHEDAQLRELVAQRQFDTSVVTGKSHSGLL